MLTRAQQILLKRAQAQAKLGDADYREAIEVVSGIPGCRSSKDKRLTDEHLDALLAYIEAIFWHEVDRGNLSAPAPGENVVFRARGYWAGKNGGGRTSRDRYVDLALNRAVEAAEARLLQLGFGLVYVQGIMSRIQPFSLINYLAALKRTIKSKERRNDAN